jgi:hypothetical protein
MLRFTAIPVAQGDSFLLERDDFTVLVDGGRSRLAFPRMFQTITQAYRVDVVICTHNDADHSKGILGFLEAGLRCDEVWLPGRWLTTLPDVLMPFGEVVAELTREIEGSSVGSSAEPWPAGISPLESYAERINGEFTKGRESNDGPDVGQSGWPEPYVQMLEQAEPWESVFEVPVRLRQVWLYLLFSYCQRLDPPALQLLWSAIDAANRIRAIAVAAFHRGIPVRWFEFNVAAPSGGRPALSPLNSRAIAKVQPRVGSLLWALALTESNKESLVFWSEPTNQQPGVLFTADSGLEGIRLPTPLRHAIVTAPHHGSDMNASAYARVATVAPQDSSSITWVRSDGNYSTRPGKAYLSLSSRRLCTLCRLGPFRSSVKQAVRLFSRGGVWTRNRATAKCLCR